MGFTPRAIRRVRRNWLVSSSGVISSYLWFLSLKIASSGANTLATFLRYPCLGPQMTTSDKLQQNNQSVIWCACACACACVKVFGGVPFGAHFCIQEKGCSKTSRMTLYGCRTSLINMERDVKVEPCQKSGRY